MRYAIGVDLGGTNIRAALVNELGEILEVVKEKTTGKTIDSIKKQIIDIISKLDYKKYNIEGIGIGVPGPVKPDGTIIYIPNLGINEEVNLKQLIEEELRLYDVTSEGACEELKEICFKETVLHSLARFCEDAEYNQDEDSLELWEGLYNKVTSNLDLNEQDIEDINACVRVCTVFDKFDYNTFIR